MTKALKKLSEEQIEFICKECSVEKSVLFAMDEDSLYDKVYDFMCDIECAETPTDGPISKRCETAADIVTILGNAL